MSKLIAAFSGKSQTFLDGDQVFTTAIKKHPVTGPLVITKQGVKGNEVANHKNALYAVNLDGYFYWQSELKVDNPWPLGHLGENLVFFGLSDEDLNIGDKLVLQGGEVILQVSGCRTPCRNLLWHLSMPTEFIPQFQSSGHTGFYLEVLKPGVVSLDSDVTLVKTEQNSIGVAALARFFMSPSPSVKELKRLLSVDGMGLQMRSMLTAMLNRQHSREFVSKGRWSDWLDVKVDKVTDESFQVKSFHLKPTEPYKELAGFLAGQFLSVRIERPGLSALTRCWSLSDYDEALNHYRISIKREANGRASNWMFDQIEAGDRLQISVPAGQFTLDRSHLAKPIVLLSAGIGITPMVAMLKSHATRLDKDLPTLLFIHSTADQASHVFHQEVEDVIAQHDMFHSFYFYTQAQPHENFQKNISLGRINQKVLERLLDGLGCWFAGKWVDINPDECLYYVCGPEFFIKDINQMLSSFSVSQDAIFFESFGPSSLSTSKPELPDAQVHFVESGKRAHWSPNNSQSLLELAEELGLNPTFSCRSGQCGLCRCPLKNGDVVYQTQPSFDHKPTEALLCCAVPDGDIKLEL